MFKLTGKGISEDAVIYSKCQTISYHITVENVPKDNIMVSITLPKEKPDGSEITTNQIVLPKEVAEFDLTVVATRSRDCAYIDIHYWPSLKHAVSYIKRATETSLIPKDESEWTLVGTGDDSGKELFRKIVTWG